MNNPILVKYKLAVAMLPILFVLLLAFSSSSNVSFANSEKLKKENTLYVTHCEECHGADGKSNTVKGRKKSASDLTKSKISDAKGFKIIKFGQGEMPAYKDKLTDEEITALMEYTKTFRQQ